MLYQERKAVARFTVIIKSIVPLQAFVSKKVSLLTAPSKFTVAEASLGDDTVHMCSLVENVFDKLPESQTLFGKSVDAIRALLKAFQVQFGEEIKSKDETKSRAVYTATVQASANLKEVQVLGFEFGADVDYNEVFKCLFLDECGGLT